MKGIGPNQTNRKQMVKIDYDEEADAHLIFENQCLYYEFLSKSEKGLITSKKFEEKGKISLFVSSPTVPGFTFYNFIYCNANKDENKLKEGLKIISQAKSTVRLFALLPDQETKKILDKNRFVKFQDMKGGMFSKIDLVKKPKPTPEGFILSELDYTQPDYVKRCGQWIDCLKSGFGFIVNDDKIYKETFASSKICPKAPLNCFYVLDQKTDNIVSVGTIYFDNNVCGVYNMSTYDEYRGKGIASLVLDHMIYSRARDDKKYSICVLQPAQKAIPLYERYGFKLTKGGEIYINGDNSSWIAYLLILCFRYKYSMLALIIAIIFYWVYRFFFLK